MKRLIVAACVVLAVAFMAASVSYAAEEKVTGKQQLKNFWQKLFNYPANVAKESADVVAETGKKGTNVVTKEVKRIGQVTSGEFDKTKELVTEPIEGTAKTAVDAVKGTVEVPVKANKEESASQ